MINDYFGLLFFIHRTKQSLTEVMDTVIVLPTFFQPSDKDCGVTESTCRAPISFKYLLTDTDWEN